MLSICHLLSVFTTDLVAFLSKKLYFGTDLLNKFILIMLTLERSLRYDLFIVTFCYLNEVVYETNIPIRYMGNSYYILDNMLCRWTLSIMLYRYILMPFLAELKVIYLAIYIQIKYCSLRQYKLLNIQHN